MGKNSTASYSCTTQFSPSSISLLIAISPRSFFLPRWPLTVACCLCGVVWRERKIKEEEKIPAPLLLIAHGCRRNNGQLQPRENVGLARPSALGVCPPHARSLFLYSSSPPRFFCYFSIFPLVKIVEVLFFAPAAFIRAPTHFKEDPWGLFFFFTCPTGFFSSYSCNVCCCCM